MLAPKASGVELAATGEMVVVVVVEAVAVAADVVVVVAVALETEVGFRSGSPSAA